MSLEILNDLIEEKMLGIHTAFIGKIVSMQGPDLCTVQPLDKIKAYGKAAQTQAVVSKVPILNHVRHYTLFKQSIEIVDTHNGGDYAVPNPHPVPDNEGHLRVEPLKPGDLVLCVCCERDTTSSVKGGSTTPPVGHHMIKDAIVVGFLGRWPHE